MEEFRVWVEIVPHHSPTGGIDSGGARGMVAVEAHPTPGVSETKKEPGI